MRAFHILCILVVIPCARTQAGAGPKPKAATGVLKRELLHPNNSGSIHGVRFSADGTKLIAGDYPGGVVVVWDIASGKELVNIETGQGYRGSAEYFFPSPDWQTLLVSQYKRKIERIEVDGTPMNRWEFDSKVRAWDLATGKLSRTYKHSPPRGIIWMQVSPNGKMFVTVEQWSGAAQRTMKASATLWDVKTGRQQTLGERLDPYGMFSPDSRTFAQTISDVDGYARTLKIFELPTGKERWTVKVKEKAAWVHFAGFSPDGRLLAVNYRAFDKPKQWDNEQSRLKLLDAATGREIADLAGEKNATFDGTRFAPDGRTLVAVNWHSPIHTRAADHKGKLFLFRLADKRPPQTLILGQATKGQRFVTRNPAFSPDSRWLAVITQLFPDDDGNPDPLNVPPARVHVIEVASGATRETLTCPLGFAASACFSPDGKTLATSGHGRVLLWDVSRLQRKAGGAR